MKQIINLTVVLYAMLSIASCSSTKLLVSDVSYHSIRPVNSSLLSRENLPKNVSIFIEPQISKEGSLSVSISNLSDSVMIIDKTKSFYVSPDGQSSIYYDPTVNVHSTSSTHGIGNSASVNLGAVGGALGVTGPVGQILSGINVGKTSHTSNTVSNATYDIDAPTVAIAPHSKITLNRTFQTPLGENFMESLVRQSSGMDIVQNYDVDNSYCKFGICISYSIDDGTSYKQIQSNYYANTAIVCGVKSKGKVNNALRKVMNLKPDLLSELWFMIFFNCNISAKSKSYMSNQLYDYK